MESEAMSDTSNAVPAVRADTTTTQRRRRRRPNKRRLSELTVRKAKPKAKTYLIWDTFMPGLVLRVQPSGKRSWYCAYSYRGKQRWLHFGNAATILLADARMLVRKTMMAVAEDRDVVAERKAERSGGTFADLHQKYLDQHAKRNNKSWKQADALIRRNALPKLGQMQATSITRADIKAMMAKIEAPVVANQTLAAVSAIFTWGVREEIVAANPCKLISRNPTKSRERVLSESELPLFWRALADVDAVDACALRTILLTGQRPGEVAHMRREHLKDGWWEMPGEPVKDIWPGTKNAAAHRVWIPQAAQALLGDGSSGFVFAGARGGRVSSLDVTMRAISAKLCIERATPHDLRRTHGSTVTALGFGRDAMNRIQNHREGGIASVYDRHGYAEENKRIMESVAARIMALVEGRPDGSSNVVAIRRG
jgi:integrase